MRRGAGRGREGSGDRRLEIVEAARRVALRHLLLVDGAIHLLEHLEELVDGIAREGVERHRRTCQLERTRRQGVDVGDPGIGTERGGETGSPSGEKELIRRRKARITPGNAEDPRVWRKGTHAGDVRGRQRRIELLLQAARADEELPSVGRRNDLELMCFGEIGTRRSIGVDDALRQQIQYLGSPRHVGGEEVIEAPVLSDDDDDVLDRRRRVALALLPGAHLAGEQRDEASPDDASVCIRGRHLPSSDPPSWRAHGGG